MYVNGNHDFSWYGSVDWVQLENNPGLFVATCHYMNSFLYPAKEWTYNQLYHLELRGGGERERERGGRGGERGGREELV